MRKQPSVIIIARHGARLDQANKDWETSAERPWDTPLSYGGWIQSQNLGARIAGELDALEDRRDADETDIELRPRKKRKVVIHTSPYLRCVQTSIGVAAGMRYPAESSRARPLPTPFQRSSLSRPPMSQAEITSAVDVDSMAIQPLDAPSSRLSPEYSLPELRIDAFLGEWLSTGYYEKTGPPPVSSVLVRDSKETLQRPPEEIKGADLARSSIQEFEELQWEDKEPVVKHIPSYEKAGLRGMAALGHSLPKRSRTVSFNYDTSNKLTPDTRHHRRARSSTYSPPVPTYSIAPQDSIPIGFVAHARDACLNVNLNWDSQQTPFEWGDGGKYEEEWSEMHRRFRNGLQQMLTFYELPSLLADQEPDATPDPDEEDLVLVIVTHQAGCNALIRLVTSAPALHDVGTASLTMAVRKEDIIRRQSSTQSSLSPHSRRRGSLDLGLGEEFDMKIIASTEHLRAGSNPLGLNSPRLGQSPAFASRRLVGADSMEGFSLGDPLSWRSSSHHTLGRSSSLRSHGADSSPITSASGSGLWSSRPARADSASSALDGGVDPKSSSITKNGTIHEEDETWIPEGTNVESPITFSAPSIQRWQSSTPEVKLPIRRVSPSTNGGAATAGAGLWGSGNDDNKNGHGGLWAPTRSSFGEGSIQRAKSPSKRRWTSSLGTS